ncbi:MAG: hypothetical protein H0X72_16640 [Acidobacteria bacterium]|jgi:hypothetical protein|nr:hypothetical protein [Acidobacteriota bacterium]
MIAVKTYKASEEVADFIALTSPTKVLAFRPSEETTQRVSDLIEREKTDGISAEEKRELDYYMQLEHLMRMAKIFARKYAMKK